jgi:transposase
LDGEFAQLYSSLGRPSIPPERLLRASLLQLLYSIRSERQLMDRLEFDLLFRWFVGLGIDDPVWDATSFTKNRERVLNEAIAQAFLSALLGDRKVKRLLSHEHFTVDGTLLKAWAGMKSFRRKDGGDNPPDGGRNGARDFRTEKRSNETHASTTDPDARLYRKGKGQESRLCYMGHVLMENRHGLAVLGEVTQATGTAEREAALAMLDA